MLKSILIFAATIGTLFSITAATAEDCSVRFSWLPNSEGNIAGYKIHYGLSDGGPYPDSLNIDNIVVDGRVWGTVPDLVCDTHYYFVCTAFNDAGLDSEYSSQIDLVVSAPPTTEPGMVTKVFGSASGADFAGTIRDTFINLNDANSESSTQLMTYTWPENMVANAIILKVDLSQLPQDAQIHSAILQMYALEGGGDEVYNISAHRVINHNPNLSTVTGYTYDGSNGWTANSACYDNIPMAQRDINAAVTVSSIDMSAGYKSWNVTDLVRAWQAAPAGNYGLLLNSDNVATADSYRTFASSEASDASQRPKLVITYSIISSAVPSPMGFQLLN